MYIYNYKYLNIIIYIIKIISKCYVGYLIIRNHVIFIIIKVTFLFKILESLVFENSNGSYQ